MMKQNEMSAKFSEGSDLAAREKDVLKDASLKLGFKPERLLGRSSWWTSNRIGAFHYQGTFKGKKAILKIQGVKPITSEIYMIESFNKTNKSKTLRPPYIYDSISWSDEKRYEALVLEYTGDERIVNSPTNQDEISEFYELYEDYRKNCLGSPWVEKPKETVVEKTLDNFKKWKAASFQIYPNHSLRRDDDSMLINKALKILTREYKNVEFEFQHGHFGSSDLYRVGNQVVILSNLYWSWRAPFYDSIFAYHWFMYELSSTNLNNPGEIETQRRLWINKINSLTSLKGKEKLLKLALLERATAGLNLDALSIDPKKEISSYLVDSTRKIIRKLIGDLR